MPSQEDYLDRLLNGLSEDEAKAAAEEAGAVAEMDTEPGVQDAETSDDIGAEILDGLDADALGSLDLGGLDTMDVGELGDLSIEELDNLVEENVEIPESLDVEILESLDVEIPEVPDVEIPESLDVEIPEDLNVVPEESLDTVGMEEFDDTAVDGLDAAAMAELDGLIAEGMDNPDADMGDLDHLDMEALDNLGVEDLSGEDIELPESFDVDALDGFGMEETANPEIEDMADAETDLSELMETLAAEAVEEEEDEAAGMTEEEIEKILEENSHVEESESAQADDLASQDNLMELLQDAGDDDLQDIHDLLEKSENNEAVDEAVIAQMQGEGDGQVPESGDIAADDAEEAILSMRQQKAVDKKKQKEEKAAAKKAAKEAKKAERLAKKAAKKAGKGAVAAAGEVAEASALAAVQGAAEGGQSADAGVQEANEEEDLGFDMSELDELINFSTDPTPEKPPKTDSTAEAEEAGVEAVLDAGEALAGIAAEAGDKEPEKKKGLLARILDFLLEEDEEDEEESGKGTEDVPLSDENKKILNEMDQEEAGKKGKKGKKPKKDKKGKKGKDAEGADGEGAEGEDGKQKKPKKEKKPKEEVPVDPKNKISMKKIMPVALASLSILLMIFLLVYLGGDFMLKRDARKAFYAEDYGTCYQELYGKKLNASEQVMFGKSESILRVRLWMREYELFAEEGAEAQALDILIQSVNDYSDLYDYASLWNADGDVSAVYAQMLGILQSKYGLTEAQALEIAAEPDDVQYTLKVMDVVEGKGMKAEVFEPVNLPDMLPEEKLFPENNGGR
ncbi:MAG: hypothetical protein K2O32_11405 [Acetatifactor sp.]|nr:hypothetical protein [Acetatifactor sp.]